MANEKGMKELSIVLAGEAGQDINSTSIRVSCDEVKAYVKPIDILIPFQKIAIEVLKQLDDQIVINIATIGKGILSRMSDVFGNPIDRKGEPEDIRWKSVHQAPPTLVRLLWARCLPVWATNQPWTPSWLNWKKG